MLRFENEQLKEIVLPRIPTDDPIHQIDLSDPFLSALIRDQNHVRH